MKIFSIILCLMVMVKKCASYKILAVFPYNGRSHHIFFSSLVEELAIRNHEVTVINYFPVKKIPNLRQISLQNTTEDSDKVDMDDHLRSHTNNFFADFCKAYDSAQAFELIANTNCKRLVYNKEVQEIINSGQKYDLVIVEQFVTDCGLTLPFKLNASSVGMTAHILMPWTYSRLGAPNNPAFVTNHFFGSGSKPNLLNKLKSLIINSFLNIYYKYIIQRKDYEIVKQVWPDTPDLESLGNKLSLILLNQYFPLTGSRLHGANIIEVGGMHIKEKNNSLDKVLLDFLSNSKHGVVYISFGSVATNFPKDKLDAIIKVISKSKKDFIWKVDNNTDLKIPNNALLRKWLPQPDILCHPNVLAFITHSGMLSSSEAMNCGVPIVSVPLFGDQYANAKLAVENGLGVTVDLVTMDEHILNEALDTVLQERYQHRAKHLSKVWKDRPLSPMDTAIYWIEYVGRHGSVNLKPPTVELPLYQYLLLDVIFTSLSVTIVLTFVIVKINNLFKQAYTKVNTRKDKKKNV